MTSTASPTITPLAGQYRIGQADGPQLVHEFVWGSDTALYTEKSLTYLSVGGTEQYGDWGIYAPRDSLVQIDRDSGTGPFYGEYSSPTDHGGRILYVLSDNSYPLDQYSRIVWTNTGAPLEITKITLAADGTVGCPATAYYEVPLTLGQGTGMVGRWEAEIDDYGIYNAVAYVQAVLLHEGTPIAAQQLSDYTDTFGWMVDPTYITAQTPIDCEIDLEFTPLTLGTGESFTLYLMSDPESFLIEPNERNYCVVCAPITVQIFGKPPAEAEA